MSGAGDCGISTNKTFNHAVDMANDTTTLAINDMEFRQSAMHSNRYSGHHLHPRAPVYSGKVSDYMEQKFRIFKLLSLLFLVSASFAEAGEHSTQFPRHCRG